MIEFNPTGMNNCVEIDLRSVPSANQREVKSSPDSAPAIILEKKKIALVPIH